MRAALASTRSLRLFEAKSLAEKILLVPLDKHEVCSIFVHYENLDLDHHRSNRLNALAKRRPPFGIVLSRSIHMLTIEDVVGAPAAAGVATRKSFFSSATATGHPQDAGHYHSGNDRSVETVPPSLPDLLVSDNRGLRFPRRRQISGRGGRLPFAPGCTRHIQARG